MVAAKGWTNFDASSPGSWKMRWCRKKEILLIKKKNKNYTNSTSTQSKIEENFTEVL